MPYACLSLEFASGFQFPPEVMATIIQQMATLPPGRRQQGFHIIEALGAAIQSNPATN